MDELDDIEVDDSCWCTCHDLNEVNFNINLNSIEFT